jgi:hypothetical protein
VSFSVLWGLLFAGRLLRRAKRANSISDAVQCTQSSAFLVVFQAFVAVLKRDFRSFLERSALRNLPAPWVLAKWMSSAALLHACVFSLKRSRLAG